VGDACAGRSEATWVNGLGGVGGIVNNLRLLAGVVPAVIGVETQDTDVVPASQSFWALGSLYLENAIGNAGARFAPQPGFLGTAVHHYDSYYLMSDP
jgi:hypothetical protein